MSHCTTCDPHLDDMAQAILGQMEADRSDAEVARWMGSWEAIEEVGHQVTRADLVAVVRGISRLLDLSQDPIGALVAGRTDDDLAMRDGMTSLALLACIRRSVFG